MQNWTPSLRVKAAAEVERRRRAQQARAAEPEFRGANRVAQTTTARRWILAGPSETGKTFAALYRLDSLARAADGDPFAICRKTRADMDSTVLETWRQVIARRGGVTSFGGSRPQFYQYPNGARVWVVGLDNSGKILSGAFAGVYVNQAEELDADDWETLSTRTTGRGVTTTTPMLFGDCNPADPDHWILAAARAGALEILTSRHEDNPRLHDGTTWTDAGRATLATLDTLTGPRAARLRWGEWVEGDEDEAFLPSIALWDACRMDLPPLDRTMPLVVALDASVSADTFALVGVGRHDAGHAVRLVRTWTPHGQALDYAAIEADIRTLLAAHNVVCVTYDPYQLHYMAQRLAERVWCEPFPQTGQRLEADRGLLDAIMTRALVHDGTSPVLREHLANAQRKTDAYNRRLRIVKRSADRHVDAAVALSMARYQASTVLAGSWGVW